MEVSKPVAPVKPNRMELLFIYACPFCHNESPLISPPRPTLIGCTSCQRKFPIIPVDQRSVHYVKIMLENGMAAIDPDYM